MKWPESILAGHFSVFDFQPDFPVMKARFLAGDKETRNWRLVSLNPDVSVTLITSDGWEIYPDNPTFNSLMELFYGFKPVAHNWTLTHDKST